MVQVLKARTTVQPGGLLQIQGNDLPEGATVEVIVLLEEQPSAQPPPPLASLIGSTKGLFGTTPADADAYLDGERNSWD